MRSSKHFFKNILFNNFKSDFLILRYKNFSNCHCFYCKFSSNLIKNKVDFIKRKQRQFKGIKTWKI